MLRSWVTAAPVLPLQRETAPDRLLFMGIIPGWRDPHSSASLTLHVLSDTKKLLELLTKFVIVNPLNYQGVEGNFSVVFIQGLFTSDKMS